MRLGDLPTREVVLDRLAEAVRAIPAGADVQEARRQFFAIKAALFAELAEARLGAGTGEPPGALGMLYQSVLHTDLVPDGSGFALSSSKTTRDSSGAYYTPPAFAREITRHSFDRLIETRTGIPQYSLRGGSPRERAIVDDLLASVQIADLSCGAGDFLTAALDYAEQFTSVAHRMAANLWGVDVDPIALDITSAEVVARVGSRPHLEHGNPLLPGSDFRDREIKLDLFALGRIYAAEMALPVMWQPPSGFDLILGNPPWEKIRFERRKAQQLLGESNAGMTLATLLARDYAHAREEIARNALVPFMPNGEANTYALFPLLGTGLLAPGGVMGLVLKSAIATSPVNAGLFEWLRHGGGLREIHLFENGSRLFSIDGRERFCVALFVRAPATDEVKVSFGNRSVAPLASLRTVTLGDADLEALNPVTHTLPSVTSPDDLEALREVSARLPRFGERYPQAKFGRIVHLTTHAHLISRIQKSDSLPILEGKFIGPYTVRAATFEGIDAERRFAPKAQARRLTFGERRSNGAKSRYFIAEAHWRELSKNFERPYMLCWRSLTSATNARTTIAAIAPFAPAIQSVQFLQMPDDRDLTYLLGLFNSTAFDYLVRAMIPGIDLTQAVIRQVPVPSPSRLASVLNFGGKAAPISDHIVARVERLLLNEPEAVAFVPNAGSTAQFLSETDHAAIVSELDDLFFLAYELDPSATARVRAGFRSNAYSGAVKTP